MGTESNDLCGIALYPHGRCVLRVLRVFGVCFGGDEDDDDDYDNDDEDDDDEGHGGDGGDSGVSGGHVSFDDAADSWIDGTR